MNTSAPAGRGPMSGVWPILFAFFDADNRLDRAAMRTQVHTALSCGAPGVAVLGLATEVDKLSALERRSVIRWAAEDLDGERPLAVTVSGASVSAQRELARFAIDQGASRLILQPPPVSVTGAQPEDFYVDFFAQVMHGLPVPVGIQNAPEYLGAGLSNDALARLSASNPEFAFIKGEAPSTVIERTVARVGLRLPVLNGRGGLELVENWHAGCEGMIVALDTFDHQHTVWTLLQRGSMRDAHEHYAQVLPTIVFSMQSLGSLLCYGKRIAAWRMKLGEVHDREPALAPTAFGLQVAHNHALRLGPMPKQAG